MSTITSASATLTLAHDSLFPVAVKVEGFDVDSAVNFDAVETGVTKLGVDGKLSVGWVPHAIPMTLTLQADSASNKTFDAIEEWEKTQREKAQLRLVLAIPATNQAYVFSKCVITNSIVVPSLQRTLAPRTFSITCESIAPMVAV